MDLCLQDEADYLCHEQYTVDTRDHEDHTFCGVMFSISVQNILPLQHIEISSLWVRGHLGDIAVYVTPGTYTDKHEDPSQWTLVYRKVHKPSAETLCELKLGTFEKVEKNPRRGNRRFDDDEEEGQGESIFEMANSQAEAAEITFKPICCKPGEGLGIYIHSRRPDDMAIVYDNQKSNVTHMDRFIKVNPGLAHLSNQPFSGRGWGWGSWRQRREFVGKVTYGCKYRLWQPHVHMLYPRKFRAMVRTLLLVHRSDDTNSKMWIMPADTILYILNLCHWEWAGDLEEDEDLSEADRSELDVTSRHAYYDEYE
jgi:hypothetical protein